MEFTFIYLFAGIGGFRLAAESLNGKCVFSSEIDPAARKTYSFNFGDLPSGDITLEETKSLVPENFDCLFGGFPCQPFSVAGYRKGFEDTRGTLFYDIAEIVAQHLPKVVFLENVKNLKSHDNGRTFATIEATLQNLGYEVFNAVLNAKDYANIPQNRERIFIVAFNKSKVPSFSEFSFPSKKPLTSLAKDFIGYSNDPRFVYTPKMSHYDELVAEITDESGMYQWRRKYVRKNKHNLCPTLTANMGTGGHNVPLIVRGGVIRKLTPRECLNFQGFPPGFSFPDICLSAQYKQAGNSVVVPVVQAVMKKILDVLFLP
jgi:DNA (cytosine-5)-methyltransferase 1